MDEEDEKAPFGRPTAYRPEFAEQARKIALLGATDREMAGIFGVSEQTLNAWKKAHPDFLESLRMGKALADAEVADRLYKRALGYSHKAVKMFNVGGEIVKEEYDEHYPPDTPAASLWLRNRRPDLWRDKIEQQLSGPDGGAVQVASTVTFVNPPARSDDE